MYKKILVGFLVCSLLTTMLAACAIYDEATVPQGPQAHMAGASFIQSSVNVKKGEMLTLVDDSSAAAHYQKWYLEWEHASTQD